MLDRFVETALDRYIESVSVDLPPDGKYHPSSMFGCARQVIYKLRATEATETMDVQALRRFYIGHRLHDAVQEALAVAPGIAAFYPEFEADYPEYNIGGHGDGLILLDDGTWILLEIKSIRKSAFKFGLKEDNVDQAKTYCWVVREFGAMARSLVTGLMEPIPPLGDKLKYILIVYLEKEDLAVREYLIPWDQSMADDILARVEYLDRYRADPQSLPPRLPLDKKGKKNWRCGYCPMFRKCWNVDPLEVLPSV